MSQRFALLKFSMVAAIAAGVAFAQEPQPATPALATLTITGDIPTRLTLKAEDLASMPREKGTVKEQDGTTVEYEGVPLREVLKRAGAPLGNQLRGKALASYVIAKAHDGYEVVFTLGEVDSAFANEQILVADKIDGKPLFGYQGPLRLTIPSDKAGARSVRMLESIEVVRLLK